MALECDWVLRVGDLKSILDKLPNDMPVVLSRDGEGNSYHLLAGHNGDEYRYEEASRSSGVLVGLDHDWDDDEPCDHTNCRYTKATPVLVLWPA